MAAVIAILLAAVVVVVIATSGSSNNQPSQSSKAKAALPTPSARIRLTSPVGNPRSVGIAEIVRHRNNAAIAVLATGLPRNTRHNAYAVWLYNSARDALRLGFVNPGVGRNGHVDTAGVLPSNSGNYGKLVITIETTSDPAAPGPIVLEGSINR